MLIVKQIFIILLKNVDLTIIEREREKNKKMKNVNVQKFFNFVEV